MRKTLDTTLPFVFSLVPWESNRIHKAAGLFAGTVILLLFSNYFIWGGSFAYFLEKGTNPNSIGILMFYSVFFYLYSFSGERRNIMNSVILIAGIACVYFSGSRSAMLGLLGAYATYLAFPYLKSRARVIGFITLFFFAVMLFVALYVYSGAQVEAGDEKFLGKNVFSGRQVIWKNTLDEVFKGNFLFGRGPGAKYADISDATLSTHNSYLGVLLSTGTLGLLAYLIFFAVLWVRLCAAPRDRSSRLVAAFFIGVLIILVFETTPLSTNFGLLWAVITSWGLNRQFWNLNRSIFNEDGNSPQLRKEDSACMLRSRALIPLQK